MNGKVNSYNSKWLTVELIHSLPSSCMVIRNSNAVGKYLSSCGQASVERGFFVNRICDLSMADVPFSNDLLKSCKLSCSRYINAFELKKFDKIENEKSQKRRIKMDKIADVKEKKCAVESFIEDMEIDIEKFSFETEKEEE